MAKPADGYQSTNDQKVRDLGDTAALAGLRLVATALMLSLPC